MNTDSTLHEVTERPADPFTVLVIDDNHDLCRTLAILLRHGGHRVYTAARGDDGLTIARREEPDIIICDVGLPDTDGYHLLGELRRDPQTHHIPVIFLTGRTDRQEMRRGMALGAAEFLTKPCTFDELNAALAACEARIAPFKERFRALTALPQAC
jgi:DNA-binding response OmpR family regulator